MKNPAINQFIRNKGWIRGSPNFQQRKTREADTEGETDPEAMDETEDSFCCLLKDFAGCVASPRVCPNFYF